MTKIICFEGAHGSGKGTLIDFFLKEIATKYTGRYGVIRDSEYPEFEVIKDNIRTGVLTNKKEIITTVAETRAFIYLKHINPRLNFLDLAILDRSYYTSAVWQSESFDEMYKIIAENERRGIPKADLTFILFAPPEVIRNRLTCRNRPDMSQHDLAGTLRDQAKYLHLAEHCDECIAFDTTGEPAELARAAYRLISANKAL
ncbi:hypothetical protein HYU22_05660 [Candidatus Woesearchaeota archaeon]|nr:hypothetical protein [Candidatus Woesearchaeota archaeon]